MRSVNKEGRKERNNTRNGYIAVLRNPSGGSSALLIRVLSLYERLFFKVDCKSIRRVDGGGTKEYHAALGHDFIAVLLLRVYIYKEINVPDESVRMISGSLLPPTPPA